jgi:amino-acid N-acetyltransferase
MSRPDLTQAAHDTPIIRPAAIGDVPTIHHLLEIYAAKGNLLPRTFSELSSPPADFSSSSSDRGAAACAR